MCKLVHNRWGIHAHNVPIDNRLLNLALSMGGDCYLVIDGAWGAIPKIREAKPDAIIVNRHAVANWLEMKPEEWADEMANLFRQQQQYTKHVELECEPDIFPNFPGWGQPIVDRLKFAADWNIRVAHRLRELCPGVIIHSPPLAHERLDLPQWFEIWKPVLDACDVLDMHCYWEKDGQYFRPGLYDPAESLYRAFRYRLVHNFLESRDYHIPMMVTECGNFAPDRPDYADELIYYFGQLERDAAYMIGGCVFILKSDQANWVNDLTRQSNIESFFKKIGDAPKKESPYPKKELEPQPDTSWAKVPEAVHRWYRLLADESFRHWPDQLIPFKGVELHGDRIGAAIIQLESGGDPNAKSAKPALIYNVIPYHAWGLMQVICRVPNHPSFANRPTAEELLIPAVNIKWGMAIFQGSFAGTKGNLWEALRRYSGYASAEYTMADFWANYGAKFKSKYQEWFGIAIPEPEYDELAICAEHLGKAKRGLEGAENIIKTTLREIGKAD